MSSAFEELMRNNPMLAKGVVYQAAAERSLYEFIKLMWEYVEPGQSFKNARHLEALCEHLEAVSRGEILKLLINIPPGFSKSMTVNVFWPAWEWVTQPHLRYLTFSYAQSLTERDNGRFRAIVMSDLYRTLWGDKFKLTRDNLTKVENNKTGWKIASSVGGTGTGERGNRLIIDDPNNIKDVESKIQRDEANRWYTEVLPSRVIDPSKTAFVTIQQRSNEDDVSGLILSKEMGYEHLCLSMEFDPARKCYTSIGWEDWREEEGELLWPEMYPQEVVDRLKSNKEMSSYAYAGQYLQFPTPRGGGIIKSDWWGLYPRHGEQFDGEGNPVHALQFPDSIELIVASVDTAFTDKKENDYSAMVVFGLYREDGQPKLIMMDAWKKRLKFHGTIPTKMEGQKHRDYMNRPEWGLVELVAYTAHTWGVHRLLIENTAAGIPLIQEIRRLYGDEKFSIQAIVPKGDKVARAYAVSALFENGVILAPNRAWAQEVIDEVSAFPKGAHDDATDAVVQAVSWFRNSGWALRTDEYEEEPSDLKSYGPAKPIYDV